MRRLLILGLLALIAVLTALPAFAQEEGDDEGEVEPVPISEEVDEGEVEPVPISEPVGDPALEVEIGVEEEPAPPAWTYRFIIPLLITLTVVVVAITVIQYFNQVVKARYQPVE